MPPNPNLQREIRQVLYQLKSRYGAPVDVYQGSSQQTDYRSGAKTAVATKTSIRMAIVMPADATRKFFYSISYLAESRAFTSQGGPGWDDESKGFIFDGRDMPGHTWEVEDWVVYDGKRYDVSNIEELEFGTGWMIIGKRAKGTNAVEQIDLNVVDGMGFGQEAQD